MNESEVNLAAILNVFTSWEYADHFEGGTLEEVLLRARDQIAETGDADAIQAYEILSDAVETVSWIRGYKEYSDRAGIREICSTQRPLPVLLSSRQARYMSHTAAPETAGGLTMHTE